MVCTFKLAEEFSFSFSFSFPFLLCLTSCKYTCNYISVTSASQTCVVTPDGDSMHTLDVVRSSDPSTPIPEISDHARSKYVRVVIAIVRLWRRLVS